MKHFIFFSIAWMLCFGVSAQTDSSIVPSPVQKDWRSRIKWGDQGYLDVNMYIQWWNVVTMAYAGREIDPRYDMFVRRGRLGTSGKIHPKIFFNASFAYDGVGKDSLSAAAGIPNAEDNTTFFPRDVFITYHYHRLFNISTGYFRPRAGKESIYSSSFNISQEKSWASFQPRIHMVGRGIGRETGINIGGIYNADKIGFLYDVGMFDTNHPLIVGDNTVWSPLFTGRAVLFLGDPEMTEYGLTYFQSGYGKRKGLSIGANATYQHSTIFFNNNSVQGIDAQLNFGKLDLLFEYNWLYRDNRVGDNFVTTVDKMLTLKAAWNIFLKDESILQFVTMLSTENADGRNDQLHYNTFTAATSQHLWEVGVNRLMNRDKLKLGLHYFEGNRYRFEGAGRYSYICTSVQFMM